MTTKNTSLKKERSDQIKRIFNMLYKYSIANPNIQIGALLTEVNSGKEVILHLPDVTLEKKLQYRLNKLKKERSV